MPISFSTKKMPKKQVKIAETTITAVNTVWFLTSFLINIKNRFIAVIIKHAIWIMLMMIVLSILISFPFHNGRNIRKYSIGIANAIRALIFTDVFT